MFSPPAPIFAAIEGSEVLPFLLLDLAIIIGLARVMGSAARRIGQPAVIGEIFAGILMGPTILGRFNESWPGELFPEEVPLRTIADLGLVLFMFLVGLEIDHKLLRREGRRAAQISVSGVLLPLALGAAVGYWLYDTNLGGTFSVPIDDVASRWEFAIFLGAAMCITAFPVLARILLESGLYKTPVGASTLCAGAVDDVIAWILLAGVVGTIENGSIDQAVQAFVLTAIFAVFMVFVTRRLLALLASRYEARGHMRLDEFALIVAGLLLSAYVTEQIGIHSIFGAFLFGAVMPRHDRLRFEITSRFEDFTVIVLLPVFFLVTGLRTDLFTLNSFALVGWLALILAAATFGKLAGCALAARITGSTTRDSLVIGSLMNARGLTELVILTIGLQIGVLSDRVFAMMVIMAITTTVMAAPLVNFLLNRSIKSQLTQLPDEHPLLEALPPAAWGDWVYLNGWAPASRPPSEWSDWVALNAWSTPAAPDTAGPPGEPEPSPGAGG